MARTRSAAAKRSPLAPPADAEEDEPAEDDEEEEPEPPFDDAADETSTTNESEGDGMGGIRAEMVEISPSWSMHEAVLVRKT